MPPKPAPTDDLLALPEGTELVADYRIRRVLGAGGFGITYLADETALARLVTIKEYFPADFAARRDRNASPRSQEVAGDYQWGLDRFIEEAQTLARFDHPNIVRVHRYFRANNTAYMVLQFEEGGSFKAWLKGLKRAPRQAELDRMLGPLLDALEIIHKADFLHRDIAPDNIMVRKDGSPVLIDFGSARGQIASHSKTVSALVKPGYSPYEQYATTSSNQGPWTDIYALGATLYHAIAGKRPPDSPSRVVNDEYVPAADVALSSYRSGFLAAIDNALRIETGERPKSIAAWREQLFSPEPQRAPGRLGLRLPIARTLGRLGVAAAKAKATPAVAPGATVPISAQSPTVPAPPDAPQPKGQLLDFIDALKNHRVVEPKNKPASNKKASSAPPAAAHPSPVAGELPFGLGYGPPPADPAAPAPKTPSKPKPPRKRPAPRVLRRSEGERRAPPRPRRVWRLPSRRWRSVIFKVAAALAIASLAVAYQESAPRTQARVAGMAQTAELTNAMQLTGHNGAVIGAASADQGRWIVSAGADATLRIWSASSGALVRTIELPDGAPSALAVRDRRALAGYRHGLVTLWDLERAEKIGTYQLASQRMNAVAFTSDRDVFAAAGQDGALILVDTRAASTPVLVLDSRSTSGLIVATSESRALVVSAGAERTVRLWRADTHNLVRSYRGRSTEITAVDLSFDGRYLAAAGGDGLIRVWSSSSSRTVRSFKAHSGRALSVAFGPERLLATSGQDGTVKVWNLRTGRLMRKLGGSLGPVRALQFMPNGRRVIGAGQDGIIRVWTLDIATASGT